MFLAKHSLQRKLGQPSGTFIMCTCHQPDPVLKWTKITRSSSSFSESCKGQHKPIVLQICEFGRRSHETKANTHIVALGIEFLNTLFIEIRNSKWIRSVLKNTLSHGSFGRACRVAIEGGGQMAQACVGRQCHHLQLLEKGVGRCPKSDLEGQAISSHLFHTTQPGRFCQTQVIICKVARPPPLKLSNC